MGTPMAAITMKNARTKTKIKLLLKILKNEYKKWSSKSFNLVYKSQCHYRKT